MTMDKTDPAYPLLDGLMLLISIVAIIGIPAYVTVDALFLEDKCRVYHNDTKIRSLETESGLSGTFFIGSEGFDSDVQYYLYERKQGGWKLETYDTDRYIIKHNDSHHPVVRRYRKESTALNKYMCEKPQYNEIIVPENNVKKRYNRNVGDNDGGVR